MSGIRPERSLPVPLRGQNVLWDRHLSGQQCSASASHGGGLLISFAVNPSHRPHTPDHQPTAGMVFVLHHSGRSDSSSSFRLFCLHL